MRHHFVSSVISLFNCTNLMDSGLRGGIYHHDRVISTVQWVPLIWLGVTLVVVWLVVLSLDFMDNENITLKIKHWRTLFLFIIKQCINLPVQSHWVAKFHYSSTEWQLTEQEKALSIHEKPTKAFEWENKPVVQQWESLHLQLTDVTRCERLSPSIKHT